MLQIQNSAFISNQTKTFLYENVCQTYFKIHLRERVSYQNGLKNNKIFFFLFYKNYKNFFVLKNHSFFSKFLEKLFKAAAFLVFVLYILRGRKNHSKQEVQKYFM